ncbi:hypothetical protein BC829DRAFT_249736 [Chytridium lagenaria]|nr:hypothetical protein BC829DRAFT_249736 [Chytridium lagenaria]
MASPVGRHRTHEKNTSRHPYLCILANWPCFPSSNFLETTPLSSKSYGTFTATPPLPMSVPLDTPPPLRDPKTYNLPSAPHGKTNPAVLGINVSVGVQQVQMWWWVGMMSLAWSIL